MANDNVMVASAVIIPEAAEDSITTSTGATKRRQSSISQTDGDSKRARLSIDATPPKDASSTAANDDRTQSNDIGSRQQVTGGAGLRGKEDERKRGKRLFGSLLGTLSQSSSSSTKNKRRADIDKKQQEKLKSQLEEDDKERKRHLNEVIATREKEQVFWDEESMHLRHANTLAMAHYLKTESTPVLYFKPWDLTPDEEERINKQIAEAEKQIAQELEVHGIEKTQQLKHALEGATTHIPDIDTAQVSENVITNDESLADTKFAVVDGVTGASTNVVDGDEKAMDEARTEPEKDNVDDNEEVVVEAGEDAVIW